ASHRAGAADRDRTSARSRARRRLADVATHPRRRIDLSPGRRDEHARFTLVTVPRVVPYALAMLLVARAVSAQPPHPPQPPLTAPRGAAGAPQTTQPQEQTSDSLVVINQKHYIRQGNVEIHDAQSKTDIYADLGEFFEDENRAVFTGNVVLSQGANR